MTEDKNFEKKWEKYFNNDNTNITNTYKYLRERNKHLEQKQSKKQISQKKMIHLKSKIEEALNELNRLMIVDSLKFDEIIQSRQEFFVKIKKLNFDFVNL
jgi:hypothetical protein